ncbi:MAG: polymer-forming cytoskeletal protein, partial [Oscillospiraceae bacterium]|nr:polymer-forming cytoskeletal protein [Oscillospiraceae bacterium]
MKKTTPKRLKGTVLFTVVSVMMVLIVFLAATLALASTANTRAYRNYQREQTKANAKAALDSVIQAINDVDKGVAGGLNEQISKLSLGGSISLEVEGSDGLKVPVTISMTEEKSVYNEEKKSWVDGTIYEIKAEAYMASTGEGVTYCAYMADDSIASPGTGGSSGGGGAFVAYGGLGDNDNIGTSGFVAGGTEIGLNTDGSKTYKLENTTIIEAPFYVNGSFYASTQAKPMFTKLGDFFAVEGDLTFNNGAVFDYHENLLNNWANTFETDCYQVPCVYVGGTFNVDNYQDINIGNDTTPINLYAGKIDITTGGLHVKGDVYTFDATATSSINNGGKRSDLYEWVDKTIMDANGNRQEHYKFGNYYSKGSLDIIRQNNSNAVTFEHDVRMDGDLSITSPEGNPTNNAYDIYVGGDLVVGGTLTIPDKVVLKVDGNVYAENIVNTGELVVTGDIYTNRLENYNGSTQGSHDFGLVQANKLFAHELVNHDTLNCFEIQAKTFENNNASKVSYPNATVETPSGSAAPTDTTAYNAAEHSPVEAPFVAYDIPAKYGQSVYPDGFDKTTLKSKVIKLSSIATYPQSIDDMEATLTRPGATYEDRWDGNKPSTINDPSNPYKDYYLIENSCTLKGSWNNNIYIKATTPMIVEIDNFSLASGKEIVVEDNATVYFFIKDKMTINGNGGLWTKSYREKIKNNVAMDVYEVQPNEASEYYPNIIIYSADGATYTALNGTVTTAHFRAPGLKFDQQASGTAMPAGTTYTQYDDASHAVVINTFSGKDCGVIGQLICKDIVVGNTWGMMYVTLPKAGGGGGGGGGG